MRVTCATCAYTHVMVNAAHLLYGTRSRRRVYPCTSRFFHFACIRTCAFVYTRSKTCMCSQGPPRRCSAIKIEVPRESTALLGSWDHVGIRRRLTYVRITLHRPRKRAQSRKRRDWHICRIAGAWETASLRDTTWLVILSHWDLLIRF